MKKDNKLVIKSNSLIEMQTDLKLTQLKLFTKVIMQTVKEPNREFCRFSIQELMEDFKMTDSNYTALKSATAGMIKAVILKNIDGEVQLPLFIKVVYDKGIVDMYLHPDLKPYILDIKERYTKYFFKSITGLNSMYSMRIYELLKQYEFRNSRSFELKELRFLLNIWEGKYSKYTDFKKRVLISSQKELKEKTDIYFEFTEFRERRKVVRLDFKIFSQDRETIKPNKTVSNSSKNSLETVLQTKLHLTDNQIKTVLKQFDKEHIERNISYTLKQKNIKNLAGYFMKALELDFWQSLLLQQEQKNKAKLEAMQKELALKKAEEEKTKKDQLKKQKIQEFIDNSEEEVIKLIPDFIKSNSFILQNTGLDLENIDELLAIIKGQKKEFNHIKSLFMGFIAKVVLGSQNKLTHSKK